MKKLLFLLLSLFLMASPAFAAVYPTSATSTSANLLFGKLAQSINSFSYNASSIPSGTGLKVQFSQDSSTWKNSAGTIGGWDTMSQGQNSISLTTLGWTGANFYYRVAFTGGGTSTPVLDEVIVNYTSIAADCSVNASDGTCGAKAAGQYSLPACQRCDGSSLTHANITNGSQDVEGTNQSGSCYSCDGAGTNVARTVDGSSATALGCTAGQEGCRKCTSGTCGYYTSSQHSCSTSYVCNTSGSCALTVNGVCGTKNGKYAASTPTGTQACTAGTITGMGGSYSWTCAGENEGSSPSCATVAATYAVVSWTTVETTSWTVPTGVTSVEYLVVGGGGGGGMRADRGGGGGGAGGFRTATGFAVANTITVTVGAGGGSTNAYPTAGGNGGNSVFSSITSTGGGGGGTNQNGADGGSGGGGWGGAGIGGGLGTTGQGNNGGGGSGQLGNYYYGGGGGGAGSVGQNGTSNGANGGAGLSSAISGSSLYYAGGGGGGSGYWAMGGVNGDASASYTGGSGVGGNGTYVYSGTAQSGVANTGSGGGGADGGTSGAGGSGVVIIKYINNY